MSKKLTTLISIEYQTIFKNSGVILILILAPFIYALLYGSGYAMQVVDDVPIAVIDNSNSSCSREFISLLNASPYITTAYQTPDISNAKELLFNRKIYGIVYIPESYDRALLLGQQSCISLYCDASYFLMYRQVFKGVTDVIADINQKQAIQSPVIYQSHTLFNPYLGYGSFIMPAILLVILQQTAIMGIGMIGSISNQHSLSYNTTPIKRLTAKVIVYSSIYGVTTSIIFTLIYHIFGYPTNGTLITAITVIGSYILAFIMLAIAISTLFNKPEQAILSTLWTSIPVLLVSGASLPIEAFPKWMYIIGELLLPSSSAISAYIKVQSMGATIVEISNEILYLWTLTAIYGVIALLSIKKRMLRRTTKS